MTLRTTSRGAQALVRAVAAFVCLAAYVFAVRLWGTADAAAWYAPEQMRFFLPCLVLFGLIAYETRWDGIVRKQDEDDDEAVQTPAPAVAVAVEAEKPTPKPAPAVAESTSPTPVPAVAEVAPLPAQSAEGTEENEAWRRAREMAHAWIPDFENDAEYLKLVHQAADEGCVPALLKLGEYASRRGALVETYFWIALAGKRGYAASRQELQALRKEWVLQGCPPEYENEYAGFPKDRGSVARALLEIACGIDVPLARQRLRDMAALGLTEARLMTGS